MECEKCSELLGDFLDGTLAGDDHALLGAHLDECLGCACVRDEIRSIVSTAAESREHFVAPPNERALWLRVRNTIEAELGAQQRAAAAAASSSAAANEQENFLTRLMNKRWALSLPQLTAAVAAIVVGVAVVTTVGMQRLGANNGGDGIKGNIATERGGTRKLNSDQVVAIEYLMKRVEERKGRWNPRMREAFDRNLGIIDAAVSDSLKELDASPHDEISEEALNAALRDKMELLREFSEL
ncbi:MAG TPA: zf-HC2 domain-containing protein [Pyrinomonadaceae bacterium]|nr:zf-HC2 domain-containing protein [Pyrinomonadaceae bacterium]